MASYFSAVLPGRETRGARGRGDHRSGLPRRVCGPGARASQARPGLLFSRDSRAVGGAGERRAPATLQGRPASPRGQGHLRLGPLGPVSAFSAGLQLPGGEAGVGVPVARCGSRGRPGALARGRDAGTHPPGIRTFTFYL